MFKSFPSVHDDPFHVSELAFEPGEPPTVKPAVLFPDEYPFNLTVFKSATSVQDEPSKISVSPPTGG